MEYVILYVCTYSSFSARSLSLGSASFDAGPETDYAYDQSVPDDGAAISVGLRVRHPVFGFGTVAGVIGSGPGQKLRIQFDRAGLKTVMLRYANLELG